MVITCSVSLCPPDLRHGRPNNLRLSRLLTGRATTEVLDWYLGLTFFFHFEAGFYLVWPTETPPFSLKLYIVFSVKQLKLILNLNALRVGGPIMFSSFQHCNFPLVSLVRLLLFAVAVEMAPTLHLNPSGLDCRGGTQGWVVTCFSFLLFLVVLNTVLGSEHALHQLARQKQDKSELDLHER